MGELVAIARLGRAHGLDGTLLARPLFDGDPAELVELDLRIEGGPPVRLASIKVRQGGWRLRFAGVSTPEEARLWTGRLLLARPDALPERPASEPYHFELIGMTVVDRDGRELGRVLAIESLPAGDSLVLDERGDVLIPFRPMVVEIRRERRELVVEIPDGLLDVNRS